MEKETYQISEAEQLTGEKAHVLRYWEDELGLTIGRNAMGHRFYTTEDIQIFLSIKELKKKGLHLKAIRDLLPKLRQAAGQAVAEQNMEHETEFEVLPAGTDLSEDIRNIQDVETVEVREIDLPAEMTETPNIRSGQRKPKERRTAAMQETSDTERQEQFYRILDRLLNQLVLKKRQEERYKRVDEAIRKHQQSRKEAAATAESPSKKSKNGAGHTGKKGRNK